MADRYRVTLEVRTGPLAVDTHFVEFITDDIEVAEAVVEATASGTCSAGCKWVSSWYDRADAHPLKPAAMQVTKGFSIEDTFRFGKKNAHPLPRH